MCFSIKETKLPQENYKQNDLVIISFIYRRLQSKYMLQDQVVSPEQNVWKFCVAHCFMQDEAPPDFILPVHAWLNSYLPGQWTRCQAPTECPLQKSYHIKCYVFLAGCTKEEVYHSQSQALDKVEQNIKENFAAVPLVPWR